eukprot:scaffold14325_cov222-Isochrysis_galbana.AAC.2
MTRQSWSRAGGRWTIRACLSIRPPMDLHRRTGRLSGSGAMTHGSSAPTGAQRKMCAIRPGFFVPRWPEEEAGRRGEAGALPTSSLIAVSDVTGLGPALRLLEWGRIDAAATAVAYASSSTGTMSRNSGRQVGYLGWGVIRDLAPASLVAHLAHEDVGRAPVKRLLERQHLVEELRGNREGGHEVSSEAEGRVGVQNVVAPVGGQLKVGPGFYRAEGEDLCLVVVGLAERHLWRHVAERARQAGELAQVLGVVLFPPTAGPQLAQPKVIYHHPAAGVEADVGGLNVAMEQPVVGHPLIVTVPHRPGDLHGHVDGARQGPRAHRCFAHPRRG